MPARPASDWLVGMVCWLGMALALSAQDAPKPPPATPSHSVQQQLDELRAGQQRLFHELAEIKKLLRDSSLRTDSPARTDFAPKPAPPNVAMVNVFGEPFRGTNSARAAIIEYSDFNCSFCGRYARNIFPRVDAEYVQAGKVRYFFPAGWAFMALPPSSWAHSARTVVS